MESRPFKKASPLPKSRQAENGPTSVHRLGRPMSAYSTRAAGTNDLRSINRIIESAVMNWPVAFRMKRRAVSPLQYDEADLRHLEILVGELHGAVISVAGWEAVAPRGVVDGGGLFHGLYVLPIVQGQGLGRHLMEAVFESARRQGLRGLLIKAHRISRSYFEHQGLERKSAEEGEYPWQYWKGLERNGCN